MNARVLLTGGAGYIGSVLTRRVLADGDRVTILDRFFFGAATLPAGNPGLTIVTRDTRLLAAADLAGVDAVIDLAAISNDPAGELNTDRSPTAPARSPRPLNGGTSRSPTRGR